MKHPDDETVMDEYSKGRRDGYSRRPYDPGGKPFSKCMATLDINIRNLRPGADSYRRGYFQGVDDRLHERREALAQRYSLMP